MEIEKVKGEPTGYFVVVPGVTESESDLDLRAVLLRLWRGRYWLLVASVLGAAIGVAHALTATRIYRSTALLAVRSGTQNPLALLGSSQLGSIASLAGVGLSDSSGHRSEYIAFLKSRDLEEAFIESHELRRVFFSKQWDRATHAFRKNWKGHVPSLGDAVKELARIRKIKEEQSGLLTVSFEWSNPMLAATWTREYVALANEKLRHEAMSTANESLDYLEKQLKQTTLEPLRQSLFSLIERRLNEAMVANVQHEYAFKVIDHPEASERDDFVRPVRKLDILLGIILGAGVGVVFVLWKFRGVPS